MTDQTFGVRPSELFNMVDAVFFGNPEKLGRVEMYASEKGRVIVDGLFPRARVRWTDESDLAEGWFGFDLDVVDVIANTKTRLPLDIVTGAGMTLDECSPTQFALLLAFGVLRDGGRSAVSTDDGFQLFGGTEH
jgi:hypothetical protein